MSRPLFDTLLFDGDVIAFICAAAVQHSYVDTEGNVRYHGDTAEGILAVQQMIDRYRKRFGADGHKVRICLSDRDNWRYRVDPNYKNNRDEDGAFGNRPLLLNTLKSYLMETWGADYMPLLEADDYLSILMTQPMFANDSRRICIGRDKDFKCIPGWHYQIKPHDPEPEAYFIDRLSADMWHYAQSIAGDATDGFKGCPGMGIKRAQDVLGRGVAFYPVEGTLTRGANKGQKTIKWLERPATSPWDTVVSCFVRAGLGEMEALDSARMAHLLRHGEYNFTTGEVKLWEPPTPTPSIPELMQELHAKEQS